MNIDSFSWAPSVAVRHDSDAFLRRDLWPMSQAQSFPPNLLRAILEKVDDVDVDAVAAQQVCRHWRAVARDPSLPGPQRLLSRFLSRLQHRPLCMARGLRDPAAQRALGHARQVALGPSASQREDRVLAELAADDDVADSPNPHAAAHVAWVLQMVAQLATSMEALFCGWEGAGSALRVSAMFLRPGQLRRLTLHCVAAEPAHVCALLGEPGAHRLEHLDLGHRGVEGLRDLACALTASSRPLGGALTSLVLTDSHDCDFGLSVVPYLKCFSQLRHLTMGRCLEAPSREDGDSLLAAHVRYLSTIETLSLKGGVSACDLLYATHHPAFGAVRSLSIRLEDDIHAVFGQSWPAFGAALRHLEHLALEVHNAKDFAGFCATVARFPLSARLFSLELEILADPAARHGAVSEDIGGQSRSLHLHHGLSAIVHARTLTALQRLVVAGVDTVQASMFTPLFQAPLFPHLAEITFRR